jgi:hypothetical protein
MTYYRVKDGASWIAMIGQNDENGGWGGWGYDNAPNQWKRGKWNVSVGIHGASKIKVGSSGR